MAKERYCQDCYNDNRKSLDEYITDVDKAIQFAEFNAGTVVGDDTLEESERDRLAYIKEELKSLTRQISRVMDCYKTLAEDADRAVDVLKGDA